jgi:tRNA (guanine37-N1)-methyltransferase
MRIDVVTIFPEFFAGPFDHGIVRRAREAGVVDLRVQDLRRFTHDRHHVVDDRPFGGGDGMVLKPEPLFEAVESLLAEPAPPPSLDAAAHPTAPSTAIVLLSASGKLFRQPAAERLAACGRVILLCGRYEGVDERVAEHLATEELSIGDFVLSGGELAAALVADTVTRLLPGALGSETSSLHESFSGMQAARPHPDWNAASFLGKTPVEGAEPVLVEGPQYTRPAEFRGWAVPEVLLGGNHEEIRRWRRAKALEKTMRNRPDLLAGSTLSAADQKLLRQSLETA